MSKLKVSLLKFKSTIQHLRPEIKDANRHLTAFRLYRENLCARDERVHLIRMAITWHMRAFIPVAEYGAERERERDEERDRFLNALRFPQSRHQFICHLGELIDSISKAGAMGLIANPIGSAISEQKDVKETEKIFFFIRSSYFIAKKWPIIWYWQLWPPLVKLRRRLHVLNAE